jgi:hypothetical protein
VPGAPACRRQGPGVVPGIGHGLSTRAAAAASYMHRPYLRTEAAMVGRRTAIRELLRVIALLERAQDAGRDVGESILILREMIAQDAGPAWCQCGHVEEAHRHHWRSTDCTLCKCERFRLGG